MCAIFQFEKRNIWDEDSCKQFLHICKRSEQFRTVWLSFLYRSSDFLGAKSFQNTSECVGDLQHQFFLANKLIHKPCCAFMMRWWYLSVRYIFSKSGKNYWWTLSFITLLLYYSFIQTYSNQNLKYINSDNSITVLCVSFDLGIENKSFRQALRFHLCSATCIDCLLRLL